MQRYQKLFKDSGMMAGHRMEDIMDDKNLENKDTGAESEGQNSGAAPIDRDYENVNKEPEPNKGQPNQNGTYDYGQDYGRGQGQHNQGYGYGQQQERGQSYNYGQYQTGQTPNYGPGGTQQYNNAYRPQPPVKSNSFALVALIMGIASILLACCSGIGGVVMGSLGIIFAIISRGKEPMCTQAKIGLGVSIAGIVLGIIVFVASLLFIGSGEFQRMFEDELHRYGYEHDYDYDYDDDYRDDYHFDGGSQYQNGLNGL